MGSTRWVTGTLRAELIFNLIAPKIRFRSLSPPAALLYALFGIPIILLYLSTMGEGLSSAMRCIFKRLRASSSKSSSASSSSNSNSTSSSTTTPSSSTSNNILGETTNIKSKAIDGEKRQYGSWNHSNSSLQHFHNPQLHGYSSSYLSNNTSTGNHHKKQKQSAVPISICIMILICYITSGAALFHELQKWGVLESLYFCFTALSTIGFGDLQPKDDVGMYAASAYIIVGMAIVAMCFSLIQTELIIWLRKFAIQEPSPDDEIALVNVAITPIKSWHRPNDLLLNDYNSLPRTPRINMATGFHRNTPARRSTGILESQMEYFVPRSVSEFNLSGVGDLALPPPPKRIQQTIVPITPMTQTTLMSIQKPREKMVTFEDESGMQKCPHGVPTTPSRKAGQQTIISDVFMWRGDDDMSELSLPLDFDNGKVIKVWSGVH